VPRRKKDQMTAKKSKTKLTAVPSHAPTLPDNLVEVPNLLRLIEASSFISATLGEVPSIYNEDGMSWHTGAKRMEDGVRYPTVSLAYDEFGEFGLIVTVVFHHAKDSHKAQTRLSAILGWAIQCGHEIKSDAHDMFG